jgi:hypothetical protein
MCDTFSFLLGMELLDHIVILNLTFWELLNSAPYMLTNTGYYFVIIIIAILVSMSSVSLWFWFGLPWYLIMLTIFSCVYWPFVYILWENVYSDPLSIFNCPFAFDQFWVNFCMQCEVEAQFTPFPNDLPMIPALLNCHGTHVKIHLIKNMKVYSLPLSSIPLDMDMSVLMPVSYYSFVLNLHYCSSVLNFNIRKYYFSKRVLLFQECLAILGPLGFYMNSGIHLSISTKKPDGIW